MPGKSSSASRTPTGTGLRSALPASWQEEARGTGGWPQCPFSGTLAVLLEEALVPLLRTRTPTPENPELPDESTLLKGVGLNVPPPHWKGSGLSQRPREQQGTRQQPRSPFSRGGDPCGGSSRLGAPARRCLPCLLPAPAWAPGKGLPELAGHPELWPPAGRGGRELGAERAAQLSSQADSGWTRARWPEWPFFTPSKPWTRQGPEERVSKQKQTWGEVVAGRGGVCRGEANGPAGRAATGGSGLQGLREKGEGQWGRACNGGEVSLQPGLAGSGQSCGVCPLRQGQACPVLTHDFPPETSDPFTPGLAKRGRVSGTENKCLGRVRGRICRGRVTRACVVPLIPSPVSPPPPVFLQSWLRRCAAHWSLLGVPSVAVVKLSERA